MHHVCHGCRRDYPTADLLIQHFAKSTKHAYCARCDEHFYTLRELYDHKDEAHIYCRPCDVMFRTNKGLARHREEEHSPSERTFSSYTGADKLFSFVCW